MATKLFLNVDATESRLEYLRLVKELLYVDADIENSVRRISELQIEQRNLYRRRDAISREIERKIVEIGTAGIWKE